MCAARKTSCVQTPLSPLLWTMLRPPRDAVFEHLDQYSGSSATPRRWRHFIGSGWNTRMPNRVTVVPALRLPRLPAATASRIPGASRRPTDAVLESLQWTRQNATPVDRRHGQRGVVPLCGGRAAGGVGPYAKVY